MSDDVRLDIWKYRNEVDKKRKYQVARTSCDPVTR